MVPDQEPDTHEIEVWSYPPELFAERHVVAPLSLYLSLRGNPDERIMFVGRNDGEIRMVNGLDIFRGHFQDYADRYVLIGGTACEIAMARRDLKRWDLKR